MQVSYCMCMLPYVQVLGIDELRYRCIIGVFLLPLLVDPTLERGAAVVPQWWIIGGVACGQVGNAAAREVVPDLRHLVVVGVPMYVDDQPPPAWI